MKSFKVFLICIGTLSNFQLFAFHVLEQKTTIIHNFEKPTSFAISTINNKAIIAYPNHFKFMVSGHFHGSSSSVSGMPASTLLANIDTLNSLNLAFTVCLGDLFLNVESDYRNYEKFLFKKLSMPLFNAVGNHDVDNDLYKKRYGKTFEYFDIGTSRFIILDTELDNGDIVGDQFSMLKKALGGVSDNVFIFMHRTLWADDDQKLSNLFPDNTRSATSTNFRNEVMPLIEKISKNSKIYLFSGSIGGTAPASFLYHKLNSNIIAIATAIRDLPRDAVLVISLNDSEVDFETMSLNTNKVLPLQEYTVSWWKKNKVMDKPFNWRLIPLYVYQMITHRYFWYGVGYILVVMFSIILFKKVRIKREAKK